MVIGMEANLCEELSGYETNSGMHETDLIYRWGDESSLVQLL